MLISEGDKIQADAEILELNDLAADESILTGESEVVWKSETVQENGSYWKSNQVYAGTIVTQGSGTTKVLETGKNTEYGKIGINIASVVKKPSILQDQVKKLVRIFGILGIIFFVLACIFTWRDLSGETLSKRAVDSLLAGITLAMALIPEEFPVILTVFLSMGAWRLARKNALIRRLASVETLGKITTLCVDKTGTLTQNIMKVQSIFTENKDKLLFTMAGACETNPYDPMEKAMLEYCGTEAVHISGELVHEYPFTNKTKRMGHVWDIGGNYVLMAKGSPESMLPLCGMSQNELAQLENEQEMLADKGLRVIAVCGKELEGNNIPVSMDELKLDYTGLVGLADPPRESVKASINLCNKAGIKVVMITGDNKFTAEAIAEQIDLKVSNILTGPDLESMRDDESEPVVKNTSIFARVMPLHKLKIVEQLQSLGEVVAMTGDGVNDAPALKKADIGIAMGKRGTEVAREASDMILLDDNFTTIVDTIEDGRRIYDNIKKAVQYVLVIHIPIALTALMAPLLGIGIDAKMLFPLHVVFLELIIDPTCSIVYQRQEAEPDIMNRPPRGVKEKLVSRKDFVKSVLQGLVIFAASFGVYYYKLAGGDSVKGRTMGLVVLILANFFMVQVNCSQEKLFWQNIVSSIKDRVLLLINGLILAGLIIIVYTPLAGFLKLEALSAGEFLICLGIGFISAFWYEFVKIFKKIKLRKTVLKGA
jgi:Ca2+-transporting ATPase